MSEESLENIKPKRKTRKNKENIYNDNNPEESDEEPNRKKTRKKSKKKKRYQTETNELISDEEKSPKKIKKKKKKKKQIETVEDNKTIDQNDSIDDVNDLKQIKIFDNFSEIDETEEIIIKKPIKKKSKKKSRNKKPLDNDIENDIKKKAKTPKPKTAKIKYNNLNKIIKKEENKINKNSSKKKGSIKKSVYKKGRILELTNLRKVIDLKNKNQIDLTKSYIINLFSKKTIREKDDDYVKEKDISNAQENEGKKDLNNSFADFLIEIDNSDYKGYNYTIKQNDYFRRKDNDKPIKTILNSEDAAIKKCEELMNSLGENEKWVDPDFGPQKNDGGKGHRKSILGERGSEKILGYRLDFIEWYSINEISDNPTFFYDGVESNDVMQGKLSNCWFISALSIIATKDYLLRGEFNENILEDGKIDEEEIKMMSEGIYPPIFHIFSPKGIYCFRFFKNLKWRYVIIDDRLPCEKVFDSNQPKILFFAHCRQHNEFWVPLIEKAYAKIHGSYIDLNSGFIDDGLVDMTGLVSKKILKNNELQINSPKIDEFWNLLKEYSTLKFDKDLYTKSGKKVTSKYYTRNKSMIGCSVVGNGTESRVVIQGHSVGIIAGHAYSILDVFEIPKPKSKKKRKQSRLLRLRNPWGHTEWNGKWCDDSEEVEKNKKRILKVLEEKYADTNEKIDFSKNDGTFLMRYSDFRKIFNNFLFCQNFPPNYIGVRFYDQWTEENAGGIPKTDNKQEYIDFMKNPQYYINLGRRGKLIVNLLQDDSRLLGFTPGEYNKKVCVTLFKTKNKMPKNIYSEAIKSSLITQRRDLYFEAIVEKGEYIIMPSTYKKGDCSSFIIEFYFEDELFSETKNNKFSLDQLKNTTIRRFGGDVKYELINEYIASEVEIASKNKLDFIMSSFKYSLRNLKNEKKEITNKQKTNDNDNDIDIEYNGAYEEEESYSNF